MEKWEILGQTIGKNYLIMSVNFAYPTKETRNRGDFLYSVAFESVLPILDCVEQPVFFVRDEKICYCNKAAQELALQESGLETVLGPNLEFYRQYDGEKTVQLTLSFGAQERNATLKREGDTDIFLVACRTADEGISLDSLSVLSQSLRQPLATAFSVTSTLFPLLEEQENPFIQKQTAILNKALYQLLRLAGNLMDMSRLIAGEMPMYDEKTELREFFGGIYDRVKPLCATVGITIQYACPTGKFYGVIDRQKVERAVLNLISNAMKFTPRGGKILLRVETNKNSVLIKVADNGEGLPPEMLATVFDRFHHREPLGDSRWGMGLGLPYARYVAALHGGTMILEGKPGEGTTVTMSLSLHRQIAADSVRSPVVNYDYAGGFEHCLVELADVLPSEVFDSVNVN